MLSGKVYGAKYIADGTYQVLRNVLPIDYTDFTLVKSGTVTYYCHEDERLKT